MKIQILGTGCAKCKALAQAAEAAAIETGLPFKLEKITAIADIMAFGVMTTPALAIDGKVKVSGRVPSNAELKTIITES